MPPTYITRPIIGMTITTTANSVTSAIDASESNHGKLDHRRMLHLMQYPPPISSVLVTSQPTKERRSLTSSSEEVNDDNDNDSVSSCSIEVMSVNAPYEYYNHSWGEPSSPQHKLDSSSITGMMADNSCFDDDEGSQTTASAGSGENEAPITCVNDRQRPLARRRSRNTKGRQPQPQQMARILACSSPEITALFKSSFHTSSDLNIPSRQRGLQRQVPSDMSIGSYECETNLVSSTPPDLILESSSTTRTLFLPSLCPPPPPPDIHRQWKVPESPPSPVRTDWTTPRQTNPPPWAEMWLKNSRDEKFEVSSAHILSLSSEEEDPYMSFRSSAYPMLHYSDGCIRPTSCGSRQPPQHSRIPIRNESDGNNSLIAILTSPLSKLSLHRRVSNDNLPSWNQIVVETTTNENHQLESPIVPIHCHQSTNGTRIEKLLLSKTVTVVSDDTMG